MFIDVPGAKLFTTRSGPPKGTAILAIGGWIGSSELWTEPLAALGPPLSDLSSFACPRRNQNMSRHVGLKMGIALAKALPDEELMVFAGAGHVPMLTHPTRVANTIRDFLHRRGA